MSSSLFQEALADARQLREVAEQSAKNAVIDSMTPRIRQFIEEQLLEGAVGAAHDEVADERQDLEELDLETDGDLPVEDADTIMERNHLLRSMDRVVETLSPMESVALLSVVEKMRTSPAKPGVGDTRPAPSDVRSTHIVKENTAMQSKDKVYEVDLEELMSGDEGSDIDEDMGFDMDEGDFADAMEGVAEEEEGAVDEMDDLYESLASLFEADDEEGSDEEAEDEVEDEGDDTPVEPEGEAGGMPDADEGEGDQGGIADMLNQILAKLDVIDGEVQELKSAGAMSPEAGPTDMGAMPPMPEPSGDMGSLPPGAEAAPKAKDERVYRVDESLLMQELRRLREGNSNLGTGMTAAAKKGVASGSKFISEKGHHGTGMTPASKKGVAAGSKLLDEEASEEEDVEPKVSEARKAKVEKVVQQNRDLKESLSRHVEAIETLRSQLTEMNLFNAKLLYVNRLLQDRDLSDAQRRNIIESLDRARSLREVKLLYKGLTESIGRNRGGRTKAPLVNESVNRTVSPTARPLNTSGVRLNEAVEVHRWSILAGINKA